MFRPTYLPNHPTRDSPFTFVNSASVPCVSYDTPVLHRGFDGFCNFLPNEWILRTTAIIRQRDLIIATFTGKLVHRDLLQARIRFCLPHAAQLRPNLLQDGIVSNLYPNA